MDTPRLNPGYENPRARVLSFAVLSYMILATVATYVFYVCVIVLLASPVVWRRLRTILDSNRPKPSHYPNAKSTHLLIVLGSGGHTAEMLAMLDRAVKDPEDSNRLQWTRFAHRTWLVGSGDSISVQRAKGFEEMAAKLLISPEDVTTEKNDFLPTTVPSYTIMAVPRARRIHQPLITTVITSLRTLVATLRFLLNPFQSTSTSTRRPDFPDIILSNGPGTAAIVILAALLLRFFNVRGCHSRGKMRTVYVESWARVKKLSLTGKMMERVVDRFIVQWPQLVSEGNEREYRGWLV